MQPDILVDTTRLLHECKGAPLSVLIALVACGGPAGQQALGRMTGYNAETMRLALGTLEALGYVAPAGKLGWAPTDEARGHPLFREGRPGAARAGPMPASAGGTPWAAAASRRPADPSAGGAVDNPASPVENPGIAGGESVDNQAPAGASAVDNLAHRAIPRVDNSPAPGSASQAPDADFPRPSCGGSGITRDPDTLIDIGPLPPPYGPGARGFSAPGSPPAASTPQGPACASRGPDDGQAGPDDELVDILVTRTACPRPRARQAVAAALAEGYFRPWIELQVLRWTQYVGERGANIRSPGHFVSSKLAAGEEAPPWIDLHGEDAEREALLEARWDRLAAEGEAS